MVRFRSGRSNFDRVSRRLHVRWPNWPELGERSDFVVTQVAITVIVVVILALSCLLFSIPSLVSQGG